MHQDMLSAFPEPHRATTVKMAPPASPPPIYRPCSIIPSRCVGHTLSPLERVHPFHTCAGPCRTCSGSFAAAVYSCRLGRAGRPLGTALPPHPSNCLSHTPCHDPPPCLFQTPTRGAGYALAPPPQTQCCLAGAHLDLKAAGGWGEAAPDTLLSYPVGTLPRICTPLTHIPSPSAGA
jgi:hypothetical protein